MFGGGDYSTGASAYSTVVDAYDTSLTRFTPTSLSVGRKNLAATTVGSYALFGGGYGNDGRLSSVNAYDTSLTRSTPTNLNGARDDLAATTVGNYALFGGGYYNYSLVDAYDTSLIRSNPANLRQSKNNLAATTIGSYALFGGGAISSSTFYATVDAYSLGKKFQLYPGTKYKFSGMSDEVTSQTFQEIEVTAPLNGYIKIKDATIN